MKQNGDRNLTGNLEIGRIVWAFGYDFSRNRQNNIGIIESETTHHKARFYIEDVADGSSLRDRYNLGGQLSKVEDENVVYEEYEDYRSKSGYGARKVQCLDEITKELLLESVKPEVIKNTSVISVLLDFFPDIYLKNSMADYFPLIGESTARRIFLEKYRNGDFEEKVSCAIRRYFEQNETISWPATNWSYFDFSKESIDDLQALY